MAIHLLARTYNMADGDLLQRSDAAFNSITRDAANFAVRGVDQVRIDKFRVAREAFSDFPTDEELAGALTATVDGKDADRKALEIAIRAIRNMAEVKYKGSGFYKTFGFDDLSHQTDNDLFRMGRRVVRVANTLLADLATEGLSVIMLHTLNGLNQRFDDAIDKVAAATETRDIQTQQRIGYGNELFAQLMELASIGKSLYEDTDEARYNDYVIYDAPAPTDPKTPPIV